MNRACCMIRDSLKDRRAAFLKGLSAAGFSVRPSIPDPAPGDALVIWNRYGASAEAAKQYERAGAAVLVVENGYLGKSWRGDTWLAMALGHHAGAGTWSEGDPERWDALGIDLAPFRERSGCLLVLAQRGIGEPGIASPPQWAERTRAKYGGRIRPHPGTNPPKVALARDLADISAVATWNSAAALGALMLGVPVWYGFQHWIGAGAGRPLEQFGTVEPNTDQAARLAMFRRLIWAQWRIGEIASGEAIAHLLDRKLMEAA